MKLNKTFGRIATTLVATAMLASLAAPVYAVEPETVNGPIGENGYYDDTTNSGIDTFSFAKELEMPVGVDEPVVTFTFTLNPDSPVDGEIAEDTATPTQNTADVQTGKGNVSGTAIFTGSENYTPVDADNDPGTPATTQKASQTVTINVSSFIGTGANQISEPGVYKYKLVESNTVNATGADADDFTTSDVDRTVYLFVERINEQLVVTGVELYNGPITTVEGAVTNPTKTDSVLNYYMLDGDPDDPDTPPTVVANDMTIEKVVDGTMGNKSEDFTFSFTVNSDTTNKTFNYVVTTDGVPGDEQTATASDPVTSINLSDGDTIKITGLTGTDTVTVEETDNGEGYTTSYRVTGGSLVSNQMKAENVPLAKDTDNTTPISTTITFTNTREAVSPTGLIMDIAPYVLLVVVAAAGCFVFLRKRRED